MLPAAAAVLVLSACDLQQQGPPPSYQDSKLDVTNVISGSAAAEAPATVAASAPTSRP
jgi:hypothetical protein